ncbi:hypothetical protein I4U23_028634 [Adineta vaga]|nr:hypothetical protein I4U23_028634 [Adineta vaga]
MTVTIQVISASYTRFCLIRKPNGTYIVRYPTENDEIISLISFNESQEENSSQLDYVILSVRVDETLYDGHIKSYRLPYTKHNINEDVKKILETYNRKLTECNSFRFPSLGNEFVPSPDDGDWLLNSKNIEDNDFDRMQNLGQNNAGIAKATLKCNPQHDIKIFIKRFQKNQIHFKREFTLLKDLCHTPIIACYGRYYDNKHDYLVFEDGGTSLESRCPVIKSTLSKKMSFIANVGFQLANAMIYLEKKNIVHRDLTASNVLITSRGYIRVADFGHAIKKEDGINTLERSKEINEENRFLHRFLSPECLPASKEKSTSNTNNTENFCLNFTSKSDVWSFGIVIIQMFLADPRKPYPEVLDVNNIPKHVKEDRNKHQQPKDCPDDMYLFLQLCWSYEAKDRLSFTEIRERMFRFEKIYHE